LAHASEPWIVLRRSCVQNSSISSVTLVFSDILMSGCDREQLCVAAMRSEMERGAGA
jgi:hypothetical protein